MHYYTFNIGDFIKDSAHLTLEEEAIYRRLIDLYYTTEKPIPLDIKSVSRSIRARGHEDAIALILEEFFNRTEKGFKQKRIDQELKKYREKSQKAANSAKARWNKASKKSEGNANALRTQSEGNANHKPITNNHKPISKAKKFIPPSLDEVSNYFLEKTGSPSVTVQEADKFMNHYQSNGWMVGKNKMKDWKATVRNWISRRGNYEKNTRNESITLDDSSDWAKDLIN